MSRLVSASIAALTFVIASPVVSQESTGGHEGIPPALIDEDYHLAARGLPAISRDQSTVAVAVRRAFSGYASDTHIAFITIANAHTELVCVYLCGGNDDEAALRQVANERFARDGYRALGELGHWDLNDPMGNRLRGLGSASSSARSQAASVVPGTEVDTERPHRRGELLEGPLEFRLTVRDDHGALSIDRTVPNTPPRFRSIPSNCRASFFSGGIRVYATPRRDTVIVRNRSVGGLAGGISTMTRFGAA